MNTKLELLSIIAAILCLCGCSSTVSRAIDGAFDDMKDGHLSQGRSVVQQLVDKCDDGYSVYDKANIGLAAMAFGVECDDLNLGSKGYEIASAAIQQDTDECDRMLEDEHYFEDRFSCYSDAVSALYAALVDLQLKQQIIGQWQTTYNNYILGEKQNYTETLTLNPDNTFTEDIHVKVRCTEGDYTVKAEAETSVSGKWSVVNGTLTLRYNARTLKVELVPNTFKMSLSSAAFFSGDFFASAMIGAISEDHVRNEIKQNIYEIFDVQYQDSEPSYAISLEDGELIMRSYSSTLTYSRL